MTRRDRKKRQVKCPDFKSLRCLQAQRLSITFTEQRTPCFKSSSTKDLGLKFTTYAPHSITIVTSPKKTLSSATPSFKIPTNKVIARSSFQESVKNRKSSPIASSHLIPKAMHDTCASFRSKTSWKAFAKLVLVCNTNGHWQPA